MELIIERGRDHLECLGKVRDTHGTDCMVVHSFKRPDHYFIIAAVENTEPSQNHQFVKSIVRYPAAAIGSATPGQQAIDTGKSLTPLVTPEPSEMEISEEVLDLARQLSVLSAETEYAHQKTPDVTQMEFEALNFSEVLHEVISEVTSTDETNRVERKNPSSDYLAKTVVKGHTFKTPVEVTIKRSTLSQSAIQFSALLSECISNDIHKNCSRAS